MDQIAPSPDGYRVVSLQQMSKGGRWRTEAMRAHAQPLLYWFTKGQGRITIQGTTRGWGSHNAIFLPPRTMHGFEAMGHTQGTALFLSRACADALPDHALHLRLRDVADQAELTYQVENIQRELSLGGGASDVALAHHAGLLGVWLERQEAREEAATEGRGPAAAESLAAAYTALLEAHFHEGLGVAEYARMLGVSATHLSRSCKKTSGRTASDLLLDRVHFEARRLLSETEMPVGDVAQSLGFRSPAYFTRAFQTRSGQTPTAFRRSQ